MYPPGGSFAPPGGLSDLYVDSPRQNLALHPAGTKEFTVGLDRPQRGEEYDLYTEIAGLDAAAGVRAVFVTKERRRYRIGDLRAEATDIEIRETGEVLHTLSIEGDDLNQLAELRKRLGLRGEDNIAVHNALDLEIDD